MNRGVMATKTAGTKNKNVARKMQEPQCIRSQQADSPAASVLFLQRTIGNQAVQRLFKSGYLQAKLRIGQPNDSYEQDADRVAAEVMRMPDEKVDSRESIVGRSHVDGWQTADGGPEGKPLQMKPG